MYKVGIIGFGGMASGYHMYVMSRDDVPFQPVAAFDIDPEKRALAVEKGLKAYDDVDKFFAEGDYDLVLVATANNYHCEMACRAMEAGYNVMVEKPAARNSAEIEKMIEVSEKTGKLFTVHQNRRWDPDFLRIKRELANGTIGKPYMIESRVHSKDGAGDMYGWRGMQDHGGGMLLDWGVHMLDQVLYLIDEPVKSVEGYIRSLWSEEVDDYAKVMITFESGLLAQVEVATYAPIPEPRWAVYGDRGAMTMDAIDSPVVHVRKIEKDSLTIDKVNAFEDYIVVQRDQSRHRIESFNEYDVTEAPDGGWQSLYQNLAGVLGGTEELVVKPAQVLRCMKVIENAVATSRLRME